MCGFLFCSEKAAVLESMTEGQTGTDKKSLCVLLFCMSGNQYRLMLNKGVLYQNLIADHTTPCNIPRQKPGVLRLDSGNHRSCGGLPAKGARLTFCIVFAGQTDNTRREQGGQ